MRVACVHLPGFSVQTIRRERFADGTDPAFVIVQPTDQKIVDRSRACAELGITPGMTLAAARGACPDLHVFHASPQRDFEALSALADAYARFGPTVSLSLPHDSLFVDVTGVTGVPNAPHVLEGVAVEMGYMASGAVASTPFAARALASDGPDGSRAPPCGDERRAIERLPLRAIWLPAEAEESLDIVGIRTVGAFMALPASQLARRFGEETYNLWQQAHGSVVAQLAPHCPERPVVERIWIAATNDETAVQALEPLCFRLKTLVDRATKRLKGRGRGAEELMVRFELDTFGDAITSKKGCWTLSLDLGHPNDDPALLLQLLRERISARPPPGPVTDIELRIQRSGTIEPVQLDLFGDPTPLETIETTVARLAAILGTGQGRRFTATLREDYRPEQAYELSSFRSVGARDDGGRPQVPPGSRPTRVLHKPTAVTVLNSHPIDRAPPRALEGPERLVTGWWDGNPIARDYWVVEDRWGRRSWIFRELLTNRWFLHGHFD